MKDSGSVLISILIILTLLGVFLKDRASNTHATLQRAQHYTLRQRMYHRLQEAILTQKKSTPLLIEKGSIGLTEISMSRKLSLPLPGYSVYQLDEYLDLPENCTKQELESFSTPLRFQNFRSHFTCIKEEGAISSPFRTRHNLKVSDYLKIQREQIFTVNGSFSSSGTLHARDSLLIIAGGDVHLRELTAQSTESIIEIISLNGSIIIEDTSPIQQAYLDGFVDVTVPAGIKLLDKPQLLRQSPGWIAGISAESSPSLR